MNWTPIGNISIPSIHPKIPNNQLSIPLQNWISATFINTLLQLKKQHIISRNTFVNMTQSKSSTESPQPSTGSKQPDTTPDPTNPTPEEEQQFIDKAKEETEQMHPVANAIVQEFDNHTTPTSTPKNSNKGVVQSTLNAWTLVTPKDKMQKLRKVKAQAKAAEAD